ncbi:MAG TPA: SprT family zinc-dependent metalloprotease [Dehalococcoidia bacterium]|nr:SprT family zinc-dependent metalloprotease [Dehalococcoidia bacterium]
MTFHVRRSARARYARLRASPRAGLEVVLPAGADPAEVTRLIEANQAWILTQLDRIQSPPAVEANRLTDGATLPFLGRPVTLAVRVRPGDFVQTALRGNTIAVEVPERDDRLIRAALEAWYRRQARRVIAEQVADINQSFGFTYQRITIKDQRSRWGSCSDRANLNFNWRLVLAPLSIIRYVVTHELAHLGELNHSPKFWALVASRCPEYQTAQAWLRQHGADLTF